jgi:uncharacterized membrane protein
MVSLQSLLTPSKVVEVDFQDKTGFKVKVAFLSREELIKLRKACVTTKFDRKTRQPIEELNDELFTKNYVGSVVKGWTGLKYAYLQDLMLVDLSSIKDLEEELEYSEENALVLMKNSTEFDNFISDVTSDLSNFQKFSSKN